MTTVSDLNKMTRVRFVGALGDVFEMSPWIVEGVWDRKPFADLSDLHGKMMEIVMASGGEAQLALLRAHPDLAGKAARVGALTAHSTAEQASVGLDRLTDDEFDAFHLFNAAYQEKFGFPFIIAVKDNDKTSILAAYERRLQNSPDEELNEGLRQVGRIAEIRLTQILSIQT